MKKPFAFACVLIALLGAFSAFFLLKMEQSRIRREVKHQIMRGIPENRLVRLEFSAEESRRELRWEHSREFEYRGNMYDIVRREKSEGKTVYYCWPDREESELNRLLTKLTYQSDHRERGQNPSFRLLNELLFKMLLTGSPVREMMATGETEYPTIYLFSIIESTVCKISPPPEFV